MASHLPWEERTSGWVGAGLLAKANPPHRGDPYTGHVYVSVKSEVIGRDGSLKNLNTLQTPHERRADPRSAITVGNPNTRADIFIVLDSGEGDNLC